MTNNDLKTRFLIGYEFIANNLAPGYTDDEISGFLNQAMDLIVDELYGSKDYANLAELINKGLTDILSSNQDSEYGLKHAYTTNIDYTDFRWLIHAKAKVERLVPFAINNDWIECEHISKGDVSDKWITTSINKPIIVYPKVVWHGNDTGFVVIFDNYSEVNAFQVLYVKTPNRIDIAANPTGTNELNEKLHQKIVDKAVQLAMKATDANRAKGEIELNKAI